MVTLFTLLRMKLKACLLLFQHACIELFVSLSDCLRCTCMHPKYACCSCVCVLLPVSLLLLYLFLYLQVLAEIQSKFQQVVDLELRKSII